MQALVNVRIVTEGGILEDGALVMDGGRIVGLGPAREIGIPAGSRVIDGAGLIAGPGLVDIHCHGGGAIWCYEDPVAVAKHHLAGGTTSLCCSLYHAQDFPTTVKAIGLIRKACEEKNPGNIVGIHFEGPYLNPKYGASARTARAPDPVEYNTYLELAEGLIRQWSFSPEVENIEAFADTVLGKGITMSFAHSEASPELIFKYAQKGVSVCTHIMDATGCSVVPTRWAGTREVGFDEAIMLCDSVMTEVIPDERGVHVRPLMCKLILKTVGIDRIIAITDCATQGGFDETSKGTESGTGEAADSPDINMVGEELCGSRLLMYRAVRNFMNHTGIGLVDAFRIGARNPAKAIKMLDEIGTLEVGKRADVILVDESFNLKSVILGGELVVERR